MIRRLQIAAFLVLGLAPLSAFAAQPIDCGAAVQALVASPAVTCVYHGVGLGTQPYAQAQAKFALDAHRQMVIWQLSMSGQTTTADRIDLNGALFKAAKCQRDDSGAIQFGAAVRDGARGAMNATFSVGADEKMQFFMFTENAGTLQTRIEELLHCQ